MNFESELARGEFCIPRCAECERIVWPPSEFCSHCLGGTYLERGGFAGRIVEFSEYGDRFFCMVEFEGVIRVMAEMLKEPEIGQSVRVSDCGVTEKGHFFRVVQIP